MIKSINRADLVKKFAKDCKVTYKDAEKIALEAEKALFELLKERSQVRIHGFGNFYLTTIKSHVIRQIKTKTPRIVLEQTSLKFRPSPVFKDAIYSRTRLPKTTKNLEEVKVKYDKPQPTKDEVVAPQAKKAPIEFKPIKIEPRVNPDEIRKKITERWLRLATRQKDEKPKTEIVREAVIFCRLLRQIKAAGYGSLSFSFNQDKNIVLLAGKPRRQISHLSREIIDGFLKYMDIEEKHIPQERHRIITLDEPGKPKLDIRLHSFPTHDGISARVDFS